LKPVIQTETTDMMGSRKSDAHSHADAPRAPTSRRATGYALHIGVNLVDPAHYRGWDGELFACEADAEAMAEIATGCGYNEVSKLLTTEATRDAVIGAIRTIAGKMTAEDIFLLSYAGHGGQLPDINRDEDDGQDETWCLYDGQLIDDELYELWNSFPSGCRILVVSDSCHSGTVTRTGAQGSTEVVETDTFGPNDSRARPRSMPRRVSARVYHKNREFYDPHLAKAREQRNAREPGASIRLLSGCQDNQQALDGIANGAFTSQLRHVWSDGAYEKSYDVFMRAIKGNMPETQTPNHQLEGASNPTFDAQSPFMI